MLDLTTILQISRALRTEIFKSDLIHVDAVARSNTSVTTVTDALMYRSALPKKEFIKA